MSPQSRRVAEQPTALATEEKLAIAQAALVDHRARDPVALDMREVTVITDYFLICHGTSGVHVSGLADAVLEELSKRGVRPSGVEGYRERQWILLDWGDVIVHIFAEAERAFYNLERLWSDAPRISVAPLSRP